MLGARRAVLTSNKTKGLRCLFSHTQRMQGSKQLDRTPDAYAQMDVVAIDVHNQDTGETEQLQASYQHVSHSAYLTAAVRFKRTRMIAASDTPAFMYQTGTHGAQKKCCIFWTLVMSVSGSMQVNSDCCCSFSSLVSRHLAECCYWRVALG